ncbi:MAG: protein-disulfide reductase DsbD, partial [Chlorobiaceae bacterium]|nr:protein-disulfide reductase DsbD [Chlorobiaceae bacterium]
MKKRTMEKVMQRTGIARIALLLLVLLAMSAHAFGSEFLDPGQAFRLKAALGGDGTVRLHWDIAKGYKLYRNAVKVSVTKGSAELKSHSLPKGETVNDPSSGEKMEIYHDRLDVRLPLLKAQGKFTLIVEYQGCAEDGLCYPPITRPIELDAGPTGALAGIGVTPALPEVKAASSEPAPGSPASVPAAVAAKATAQVASSGPQVSSAGGGENDMSLAKSTLSGGSLWKIGLAFLFFGLLLSFTPCVLPM